MFNLAVVEDEEIYRNQIDRYLKRYQKEQKCSILIHYFSDGREIVNHYKCDFDIILMDIQMMFMDGMSAAEKIREMDKKVVIIFITNMMQYAVRGYQVDALDYMVKPVEYFSFSQKLDKAVELLKENRKYYISVNVDDGVKKFSMDEIYYIESQKHYLHYYTKSGKYVSRGTMKEIEETLRQYHFFRISKGYLVNMIHVDGVAGDNCQIGRAELPVSRTKKKELMEEMLTLFRG